MLCFVRELFLRSESVGAGARDSCREFKLECASIHRPPFLTDQHRQYQSTGLSIPMKHHVDTLTLTVLATVRSPFSYSTAGFRNRFGIWHLMTFDF